MHAVRDAAVIRLRAWLGPVAAGGALVGLLAAGWAGLWLVAPGGRLTLVAVAASAPAMVRSTGLRRSALAATVTAVLAAIVALGAAVGSNPYQVVRGDPETWSRLGDILPEGLGRAASIPLPLAPGRSDALAGLLILVLAGAAALVAWQAIVSRRPLAAVIATATGLAYRWTLVPPDHPVFTGVAALVVALIVFRVVGTRPGTSARVIPGRAALAGVVVTGLALAGSLGAARTSDAWWNWESWTFGTGTSTTSLDVNQRYEPLNFPEEPRVVARVVEESPLPLRAVTLDVFDGNAFAQSTAEIDRRPIDGTLDLIPDAAGGPEAATQTITLTSASSPWVLTGGRPTQIAGVGGRVASIYDDGTVKVQPKLGPRVTYTVQTLVPDPGIAKLNAVTGYTDYDGAALTILPGLGAPLVRVPVWTGEAPAFDAEVLGRYEALYREARRVTRGARTPYQAVNKIETYLRSQPFSYDEKTPRPDGDTPDLVDFVLSRKTGYCQHFAGAMALMLRMNGIPARVAVGFTVDTGRFQPERNAYEITDRDAHSWVEVQFPGYGWVPFDPTPGRAVPNIASVSDPRYTVQGLDNETASAVSAQPVAPPDPRDPSLNEAVPEDPGTSAPAVGGGNGRLWWLAIPALLVLGLLTPAALKALRRSRRRRGDERDQVLGATRELEALCRDVGIPIDPALTPTERSQTIWRDLGLDVSTLYGLASAARFAPAGPAPGSGRKAWSVFAAARRRLGWRRRARAGLRMRSLRELDGAREPLTGSIP